MAHPSTTTLTSHPKFHYSPSILYFCTLNAFRNLPRNNKSGNMARFQTLFCNPGKNNKGNLVTYRFKILNPSFIFYHRKMKVHVLAYGYSNEKCVPKLKLALRPFYFNFNCILYEPLLTELVTLMADTVPIKTLVCLKKTRQTLRTPTKPAKLNYFILELNKQ